MRAALALIALACAARPAAAEAKRRVQVESDPSGADVYLNSKDDGSLCQTPCTIDAPIGDATIIVELANHLAGIENLVVPRRGRPAVARFKLVPAVGTIVVPGPKGATIKIADVERGVAPTKFDIDAGPYMVVLSLNGKQIDAQPVEVNAGEEVTVTTAARVATAEPAPEPPAAETEPTGASVTKRATPRTGPRPKLFGLVALFDVGFRNFTYDNALTKQTLRDEEEGGQVIGGGALEVWPGNAAGVPVLSGLSLFVRMQFPINAQPVTSTDNSITGNTTTFWQSFEATVKQRWTLASAAAIEVGAGYARDQYQFNTDSLGAADLDFVPDVTYDAVKLGVRASLLASVFEPYAALGYRLVLAGGKLEDRFRSAQATGIHAGLGVKAVLGPIDMRIEGALTRYTWVFKYEQADMYRADGATDQIFAVQMGLGYAY
jgi:hypothetical protein